MAFTCTAPLLLLLLRLLPSHADGGSRALTTNCADFNTTGPKDTQAHAPHVHYLLYTRHNPNCARLVTNESLPNPDPASTFNTSLPTKVIIHGYRATGTKPSWLAALVPALLEATDCNVLVVDWVRHASSSYPRVAHHYRDVSLDISILINQLIKRGSRLDQLHLIGVSLGAHVAGFVGSLFQGKVGRITALDPAGPFFKKDDVYDRLDPSDALFVESIHSDTDNFGLSIPVGHVSFFLNGGQDQPGCSRSQLTSIYDYVICDHMRAVHVYISAVRGSCLLLAIPCQSYQDFLSGLCVDCNVTCPHINEKSKPSHALSAGQLDRGISTAPLQKFFLLTTSTKPFCAYHILLDMKISALQKSAEVEVLMSSVGHTDASLKLKLSTSKHHYKHMLAIPVPFCLVDLIQIKNTGARFYRQGEIHFMSICITEVPVSSENTNTVCVEGVQVKRGTPWAHEFVQLCKNM